MLEFGNKENKNPEAFAREELFLHYMLNGLKVVDGPSSYSQSTTKWMDEIKLHQWLWLSVYTDLIKLMSFDNPFLYVAVHLFVTWNVYATMALDAKEHQLSFVAVILIATYYVLCWWTKPKRRKSYILFLLFHLLLATTFSVNMKGKWW